MALRLDWEGEAETIQLLELALIDRYDAAYRLFYSGDWDTAIYLFGYAAEIVLKTAYFRVRGVSLTAEIGTLLVPTKNYAITIIPGVKHESYHSILFWSELLRKERERIMRPMSSVDDVYLRYYAQKLYDNWMVEMRYHPNRADEAGAREVAEATNWLFDNRSNLRS